MTMRRYTGPMHLEAPRSPDSFLSIRSRFGPAYEDGEALKNRIRDKAACKSHHDDLKAIHEHGCGELDIPPCDTLPRAMARGRSLIDECSLFGSPAAQCADWAGPLHDVHVVRA